MTKVYIVAIWYPYEGFEHPDSAWDTREKAVERIRRMEDWAQSRAQIIKLEINKEPEE